MTGPTAHTDERTSAAQKKSPNPKRGFGPIPMSCDIAEWQVQDSNLRRRKPTDLQSVSFDVCTVKPCWFPDKAAVQIVGPVGFDKLELALLRTPCGRLVGLSTSPSQRLSIDLGLTNPRDPAALGRPLVGGGGV
jgi:hypothetical protein